MAEVCRDGPTTHRACGHCEISPDSSHWTHNRRPNPARRLLHLEIGCPLLLERPRSFFRIVADEHLDADLRVDLERVVLVQAFGLADRLEDGLHGERAV